MKKIALIVILIFIAIQLIPVDKSNPPVTAEIEASPEVLAIFERACYDCHSNETVWPWYSNIAPVKWSMSSHVKVGRLQLNFSEWNMYDENRQKHLAGEIWHEVEDSGMPLKSYLNMHKDAKLTQADKALIQAWSQQVEADAEEFREDVEVTENEEG